MIRTLTNSVCALLLFFAFSHVSFAQGTFSGSFESDARFFRADSTISAPQYTHQFFGANAWLNLNYSISGFDFGVRFDTYQNSNLLNPSRSFTGIGLGNYFVKKRIQKLEITAGHMYDQIGSGIAFRAYEERALGIDQALFGLRLKYNFTDNWSAKVFSGVIGKQQEPFDNHGAIIKGLHVDGFHKINDNMSIAPGAGFVNRTITDDDMQLVAASVSSLSVIDSFAPAYNVYVPVVYNTLTYKGFSWYVEAAYKTQEATLAPSETGGTDLQLRDRDGSVIYTSLSYSRRGLGINLQAKRTENFDIRTSPLQTQTEGQFNFLPPVAKENSYRLLTFYNPAVQQLGELALQGEVIYSPNKKLSILANVSNITDLENELLWREAQVEATYKKKRDMRIIGGVQWRQYNQDVFEQKPNAPTVQTITPFLDFSYRISRKRNIRAELQYMYTEQDLGQWMYGLVEFTIAPNWSFSVSDEINIVPKGSAKVEHFYSLFTSYTKGANRFTLSYVKQREGIVCTGGVCRFEPEFEGARFTVNSTF